MRRLRITLGLATVACMVAAFATPAMAKVQPKVFFGHFTASIVGQEISPTNQLEAKGKGEVSELIIGPLEIECETTSGFPLAAKAKVAAERSSNFTANVKFTGCTTALRFGKGGNIETAKVKFGKGLKMEFHANGSAAVGNTAGEVKILETAPVQIKVPGHHCQIFIPAQTVPVQDEKDPEKEFEAVEYATEKEAVEGSQLKKYPSGFKERLEIEWELTKIHAYVPVEPGRCEYKHGEEGKFEPAEGSLPARVEYIGGKFNGDLEEVEIKNGELGFDPTPSET